MCLNSSARHVWGVLSLFAVLILGPGIAQAEVSFAEPISVVRQGSGYQISFAASEPTDCAVTIHDQQGKAVRHLAAGLLGDNAPEPLAKGTLKQSLTWDGKDDQGQAVGNGKFSVHVGLGTKPALHSFIGDNPAHVQAVRGLAVGPGGEVFVFHVFGELHTSDGTSSCTVFDRNGQYLRTILPFPTGLSGERTAGLKQISREDGSQVPFLYQAETRSIIPGAGDLPPQRAVATRDGRVAIVGIREGPHRYAQPGVANLLSLHREGGVFDKNFLGTEISAKTSSGASLALSPDEQTVYLTGLREQVDKSAKAVNAVLRCGWNDAQPTLFAGDLNTAGSGPGQLDNPRSVAVDGAGNVYVADQGNNRIAVFKPDGSFLGELKVDRPERVEVHPQTGALYVVGGERTDQLQKFAAWNQPQPVATHKLATFKHPRYTVITALDTSANPPVLWVGTPFSKYANFYLLRFEDQGTSFSKPEDVGLKNSRAQPAAGPVMGMSYDRVGNRLLVNAYSYNPQDGSWGTGTNAASGVSTNNQGAGSFGLDGNFYTQIYPRIIRRLDGNLKKLPFAAQEANKGDLPNPLDGTMRVRGRGITADAQGNVYVLSEAARGASYNHVFVVNPDGTVKAEKLIETGIRSVDSVRIDRQGNIYLAMGIRPGSELLPSYLQGQLPNGPEDPDAVGNLNTYPLIYGSLVKFSPRGGRVMKDIGAAPANYAFGTPIEIEGAEWVYSGVSPAISWRTTGTPDICSCESSRFDVDDFGRSFFPDAAACRVGMLDTNGNLIGWFGGYGNADSAGPKSRVPQPEIPMFWPYNIAVGGDSVYVGDRLNRRVVRVKLGYTAEANKPLN